VILRRDQWWPQPRLSKLSSRLRAKPAAELAGLRNSWRGPLPSSNRGIEAVETYQAERWPQSPPRLRQYRGGSRGS